MSPGARLFRTGRLSKRPDGSLEALFGPGTDEPHGAAACCFGCAGCGRGVQRRLSVADLAAPGDIYPLTVDGVSAAPGAAVELSVKHSGLVRLASAAFGLPLGGLLGGALLGWAVVGESGSMLIGLVGLAAGLVWVRRSGAALEGMLGVELRPCAQAGSGTGDRSRTGAIV